MKDRLTDPPPAQLQGTVIVLPYGRLPLEYYLGEFFSFLTREGRDRHLVHKYIRNSRIEDSSGDGGLSENQQRNLQRKQNASFKLVPRSRKGNISGNAFFRWSVALPYAGWSDKLLEAQNDTARTMPRNYQDLPERILSWIIRPPQRPRFEA